MPRRKITRNCRHCEQPFRPWRDSAGLYCSQPCFDEYRKSHHVEKFWRLVNRSEGCWLWAGSLTPSGYGNCWYEGKSRRAHMISYRLHYGEIPTGKFVCHRCNVRHCVKPEHLYVDDHNGNMAYMVAQGRQAHDETSPKTILSRDQVREIRKRYIPHVITQQMLANEFGVAKSTIAAITQGKNRKHVI